MQRPKKRLLSDRGDIVFKKPRFSQTLWLLKTESQKGATRFDSFRFKFKNFRHSTKSLDLKTFIKILVQNRFLSLYKKRKNCTLLYSTCILSAGYICVLRAINASVRHVCFMS